jgi:hypothetical protein
MRIPIRKWEKVTLDPYRPWDTRRPGDKFNWRDEDQYRLEVLINGEVLGCDVAVPAYLSERDPMGLREHVIKSMSRQIAAVVADEIQRSIV